MAIICQAAPVTPSLKIGALTPLSQLESCKRLVLLFKNGSIMSEGTGKIFISFILTLSVVCPNKL